MFLNHVSDTEIYSQSFHTDKPPSFPNYSISAFESLHLQSASSFLSTHFPLFLAFLHIISHQLSRALFPFALSLAPPIHANMLSLALSLLYSSMCFLLYFPYGESFFPYLCIKSIQRYTTETAHNRERGGKREREREHTNQGFSPSASGCVCACGMRLKQN